VYSHEYFQEGRPDLLEHLRRKTNTSSNSLSLGLSKSSSHLNLSSHGLNLPARSTSLSNIQQVRHSPTHSFTHPLARSHARTQDHHPLPSPSPFTFARILSPTISTPHISS
jgi:hypothetical protein